MRRLEEMNWDDIRLFVEMAECQSLREAALRLKLTHPTVRRRLEALEAALGVRLFHRLQTGLRLTVEGAELLGSGQSVSSAVVAMLRRAESVDNELKGPIRVTMSTELAVGIASAFTDFQEQWPAIELHIETGAMFADLSRFEADVAIRGYRRGRQPPDHLAGRRAASGNAAVYGDPIATPYWIGSSDAPPHSGWTATTEYQELPVRAVVPNVLARHAACAQGMGLAMMPCLVGDRDLPRITNPTPDFDIWVLVHPDLRANPRLRIFRDAMVDALSSFERVLQGDAPELGVE